jgi:hypothetical protein
MIKGSVAKFFEVVRQDEKLAERLRALTENEVAFSRLSSELGRERGYEFDAADVRNALVALSAQTQTMLTKEQLRDTEPFPQRFGSRNNLIYVPHRSLDATEHPSGGQEYGILCKVGRPIVGTICNFWDRTSARRAALHSCALLKRLYMREASNLS